MEIEFNGKAVAKVVKDKIVFYGTDLNGLLDDKLMSIVSNEEDGVIYYNYEKPTILAKLSYLESIGYTIKNRGKQ